MTPRVLLDYAFLGLGEDMLVVVTLREGGQDHRQVSGSVGSEEDGACG